MVYVVKGGVSDEVLSVTGVWGDGVSGVGLRSCWWCCSMR